MKTIKLTLAVALLGMGLSTAAYAQETMPRSTQTTTQTTTTATRTDAAGAQKGDRATYRAARKQADADYKAAKTRCDAIGSSIEKENCIGIARAEERMRKAQAKAQYKPDEKSIRDAKIAAIELDYAKAKAKCETLGGNVNETGTEASMCMSRAAEARNQAAAAAKAQKKSAEKGVPVQPGSTMDTRGDIGKKP